MIRTHPARQLTCALLALSLAVACGGDDDPQATATSAAAEPSDAAAEPSDADVPDASCGEVRVAMNDSPQNQAVAYAIGEGLVTSDVVAVNVEGLPIPSLIEEAQSFASFDMVEAPLNGVAFGVANGAPLVVVGPGQVGKGTDGRSGALFGFVRSGSDIGDFADLGGKRIATVAIGAATTQMMGVVLAEHGVNPAVEGGDVTWLEMPYDAMPVALANGDVDFVITSHLSAYQSLEDERFSLLGMIDDEYRAVSGGAAPVLTVLLSAQPKVSGREACFDAARGVIAESFAYAEANLEEVAAAVAADASGGGTAEVVTPFIEAWVGSWFDYVADPTADDVETMQTQIDLGTEAGMNPPVDISSVMLAEGT